MSTAKKSTDQSFLNCPLKLSLLVISILFICKSIHSPKNFDLLSSNLCIFKGKNLTSTTNPNPSSAHLPPSVFSKHKRKTNTDPSCYLSKHQILFFIILLAGDIQLNPGPPIANVFPCALCELPVTWSTAGICCDECDVWHHKSCLNMPSIDYSNLANPANEWKCFKCNTINNSSFTFHSFCSDSLTSFISSSTSQHSPHSIHSPPENPISPPIKSSTPKDPSHSSSPKTPKKSPSDTSSISNPSLLRSAETYGNLRFS